MENIKSALDALHSDLWRRFVRRPYGMVLDYADADGNVVYPTREDCERRMPNFFAWWTSIENGGFFTGLYLAGMLSRREAGMGGDEEILQLANGLFRLQDVGSTEGFIARGVADDGVSHYPYGSIDQTAPWIYGLWRLYRSTLPDAALKDEIRGRLMRVITALKKNNWTVPTELNGRSGGSILSANMREAALLLFICRVADELDPGQGWDDEYERLASENAPGSVFTRPELCSGGPAAQMLSVPGLSTHFWIYLCSQAVLCELCVLDKNEARVRKYLAGAYVTALTALNSAGPLLDRYNESPYKDAAFDVDWRPIGELWRPHQTSDESNIIAKNELELWCGKIVPRRRAEHNLLIQAAYALWCAKLSPDRKTADEAQRQLEDLILKTEFGKLCLPVGYPAESAYYENFLYNDGVLPF